VRRRLAFQTSKRQGSGRGLVDEAVASDVD
jgi:hypothetical protein